MRRFLWLVSGALLLASVVVAASGGATQLEAGWVISDIGQCPDSDCAYVTEQGGELALVNERSQIAGTSGKHRAFVWRNGKMRDLGTLGGKWSETVAMNDLGQVVGWAETRRGRRHAFLWQSGKMRDLGVLPGHTDSEAVAINGRGQIVGCSSGEPDPILGLVIPCDSGRAFLWERGKMQDLGLPPGDWYVRPVAINDRGLIVGTSSRGDLEPPRAFVWRNGRMTILGRFGAYSSEPVDLNERGQIVISTSQPNRHLLWENGRTRPFARDATVIGINDSGQIAGSKWGDGVFLWEKGRIRFLSRAGEPQALNERGQVAGSVGEYADPLLWESRKTVDLPMLPGCKNGAAVSLNERNQIVGWCGRKRDTEHPEVYEYPGHIVLWTLKSS